MVRDAVLYTGAARRPYAYMFRAASVRLYVSRGVRDASLVSPGGLRVRRHCDRERRRLSRSAAVVVAPWAGSWRARRSGRGALQGRRGAVARAPRTTPWRPRVVRLAPTAERTRRPAAADSRGQNVNMISACPRIMHTDGCFKLNHPPGPKPTTPHRIAGCVYTCSTRGARAPCSN